MFEGCICLLSLATALGENLEPLGYLVTCDKSIALIPGLFSGGEVISSDESDCASTRVMEGGAPGNAHHMPLGFFLRVRKHTAFDRKQENSSRSTSNNSGTFRNGCDPCKSDLRVHQGDVLATVFSRSGGACWCSGWHHHWRIM
jgi:hypothetical protein